MQVLKQGYQVAEADARSQEGKCGASTAADKAVEAKCGAVVVNCFRTLC